MSNKRKPLLSDEPRRGWHWMDVRDFYEYLITTGKLRVVEEVDVVLMDGSSIVGHCNGCGIATLKQHAYCPGCGNKIKR